jgi:hypothetical protein
MATYFIGNKLTYFIFGFLLGVIIAFTIGALVTGSDSVVKTEQVIELTPVDSALEVNDTTGNASVVKDTIVVK